MCVIRVRLLTISVLVGVANSAVAQSSMMLYGVVDTGVAYQSRKAGTDPTVFVSSGKTWNQFVMASGQMASSRWGIKGVEDLGGGLKANFVYESAVNVVDGSGGGFTRQSTIGLSGSGWGSIDLGRRLSPGTYAFAGIDPFNYGYDQAALGTSMGATHIRLSNLVAYTSPNVGGFSAMAGWSFDTGLRAIHSPERAGAFGTSNKFRSLSLGLRYGSGSLLLAGMFDSYYSPAGANSSAVKQWNIGGMYDFKFVKLHAAFGQNIDGRVNGTRVLSNVATSGGVSNTNGAVHYLPGARTTQWMVGVTVPLGASSKMFSSFQQLLPGGDYGFGNSQVQSTASVGYNYSLSKRTTLYAYYSYMTAPDMFSGANSQVLGTGINYKF